MLTEASFANKDVELFFFPSILITSVYDICNTRGGIICQKYAVNHVLCSCEMLMYAYFSSAVYTLLRMPLFLTFLYILIHAAKEDFSLSPAE